MQDGLSKDQYASNKLVKRRWCGMSFPFHIQLSMRSTKSFLENPSGSWLNEVELLTGLEDK